MLTDGIAMRDGPTVACASSSIATAAPAAGVVVVMVRVAVGASIRMMRAREVRAVAAMESGSVGEDGGLVASGDAGPGAVGDNEGEGDGSRPDSGGFSSMTTAFDSSLQQREWQGYFGHSVVLILVNGGTWGNEYLGRVTMPFRRSPMLGVL
jgi:hypothetical protein